MVISNRVAFWDGDNFCIVTKNCTKAQAKAILSTLAELDADGITEMEESCAKPIKEPEDVMPDIPEEISPTEASLSEYVFTSAKQYTGKTPSEVLEEDGDKGFANLSYLITRVTSVQGKNDIASAMSAYFKKRFGVYKDPYTAVKKWDMENCDKFFKYFKGIANDKDKEEIVQKLGMLDFTTFLNSDSLSTKQSAIAALISKYAL